MTDVRTFAHRLEGIASRAASYARTGALARPWVRWCAGFTALVALVAIAAPWTFSTNVLREDIAAQLRSSTGLYVFTRGRTSFSLLPQPQIRLEKISFVDPNGGLVVEADELRGYLRLLPMLAGRLEVTEAEILRPQLQINLERKPLTSAGAAVRAADARPATPEASKADAARLGVITLIDGTARLQRDNDLNETFEHIDATLDWRTISSPASLTGALNWGGERSNLALWVARPSEVLRGERSALTFQITGPSLSLSTNGNAVAGARPQFEGRIVARAASLRRIARLMDVPFPFPFPMTNFQMDCDATITARSAALANTHLRVDGNEYEGSLAWRFDDERPLLSGTLATPSLALKPVLADLPVLLGADGQFSREPFDWHDFSAFDLDLRISAARARLGRLVIEDAAATLGLHDGRLEVALADSRVAKGSIKARLIAGPSRATDGAAIARADTLVPLDVRMNVVAKGVDWASLDWDVGNGKQALSGLVDASLTLTGEGTSPLLVARSLEGRANASAADGEINGLDVERALRRMEKNPLASASEFRNGRTPFDQAVLDWTISNGVANLTEGTIKGAGYVMSIEGKAQLPERQIAVRATVTPQGSDADARAGAGGFMFDINGAWDDPAFIPDAQGLIRRSGAAKPLLPAEKTR